MRLIFWFETSKKGDDETDLPDGTESGGAGL
jgi:hypothetical protein